MDLKIVNGLTLPWQQGRQAPRQCTRGLREAPTQEVSIKRPMLRNKRETNRNKPFSPRAEDSPLVMM